MKKLDKLKEYSINNLSFKDNIIVNRFIDKRDFQSISEIVESEIKKEYKKCNPEEMTERYCNLMSMKSLVNDVNFYYEGENNFILNEYDI